MVNLQAPHDVATYVEGSSNTTVSFVRFRENQRNPETDEEMGRINLCHEIASARKGDNIVMRYSQAPQEDSLPPTEDEICDNVLGKRPGYTPSLGHGVMLTSSRQHCPSMEEIRRTNEETNKPLEEAERWANDAEMSRDELGLEMVNQTCKIEELENWKARLEQFMSSFGLVSTFLLVTNFIIEVSVSKISISTFIVYTFSAKKWR